MYEWSTVGSLMFLGGITNIYKKYVDMFTKICATVVII